MSVPEEYVTELDRFPPALKTLVEAELAAGNEIVEIGHSFPAAPCGAYIKLARPVGSRPRERTSELDFYDRNCQNYSGEFNDKNRHFFVLEPPHRPEPEPDMEAIRAKLEADYTAANLSAYGPDVTLAEVLQAQIDRAHGRAPEEDPNSIVARFRASMNIDYDKWHDGIGYDIDLFQKATSQELKKIEEILLLRRYEDWRDVEALAALGTDNAKAALKQALTMGDAKVRMAVHSHAPELLSDSQRIATLVQTLEQADLYGGLSEALNHITDFHPPEIVTALLRGIMERDGATACLFAAMLYFIHGESASTFDWDHRPFFLRFNTDDLAEREIAARELFATLGVDPSSYIQPKPPKPTP